MQLPRFEILPEKKLIGKRLRMSLAADTTFQLWNGFMPLRNSIPNTTGSDLYNVRVYDDTSYFTSFQPTREFVKWATVEVSNFDTVPEGMETLTLPAGTYAVFVYKGLPGPAAAGFYNYIFSQWLPSSGYELENRPHFEIMGAKYNHNSPDSEEEIWVPVKKK